MNLDKYQLGPADLGAITDQTAEAELALNSLGARARDNALAIETAFAKAGESLSKSLLRAARDGKISLSELVKAVIDALNAGASQGGGATGLGASLAQALGTAALTYGGARATGGDVATGRAYLVGENGPEVFVPKVYGDIQPAVSSSVTVNLNLSGTSDGLVRSEAQLASALQRIVRMGLR